MENQSTIISIQPKEQKEAVVNNVVEALILLYSSVKQRKVKEYVEKIKNGDELKNEQ